MKSTIYVLCIAVFMVTGSLSAQEDESDNQLDVTSLLMDVAADVDQLSHPLVKAIEWEYQTILESQRIDNYTLLLEPSEYNYEQARKRYLKKKKPQGAMLDKIAYIDRFYKHQLPNEIVPNTLQEVRQIFELAATIEQTMPRQLIQLLVPYRFQLETYQNLGIRVLEIEQTLQRMDRLEKKCYDYLGTEAFTTNKTAIRTIAAPHLHEPQTEAAIRTQLEKEEGGTIHLVHVLGIWTLQQGKTAPQWINYGQATMTSGNGHCYLVYFDVQKPTANNSTNVTVQPYKYDPMPCEKVTQYTSSPSE